MSELESKLGAILGDPGAMAQIMSLAQSLDLAGPAGDETPDRVGSPPPPNASPDLSALLGGLGEVDPQLIQKGLQLLSELSAGEDERTALLLALKPFLKQERQASLTRAVQLARLSRVLRAGFRLLKGKEEEDV